MDAGQAGFYVLAAAGVIFIADFAPRLINGLLILILVGIVLRNVGVFDSIIARNTGAKK